MNRDVSDDRTGVLWTPARAEAEAQRLGLDPLLEKHWKIIALSREWHARHGSVPSLRELCDASGLKAQELSDLFRADPVMLIVRIAGLPDPEIPPARPGFQGGM